MNLAESLRRGGVVNLHELDGWANRGRPGTFTPLGIVVHHTAGSDSLGIIVNGRPGLPGPLAHLHITKGGRVNLVAAGRANHAGRGSGVVLDAVGRDIAPAAPAANLGLTDDTDGNRWFYGIEAENLGDHRDPWPLPQVETIVQVCAALCRAHGWTHNRVIGHLEWTRRKIDPTISTRHLRGLVASRLVETPHRHARRRPPDMLLVRWHTDDDVRLVFGPGSWVPVEDGNDLAEMEANGVPGPCIIQHPNTWRALTGESR